MEEYFQLVKQSGKSLGFEITFGVGWRIDSREASGFGDSLKVVEAVQRIRQPSGWPVEVEAPDATAVLGQG